MPEEDLSNMAPNQTLPVNITPGTSESRERLRELITPNVEMTPVEKLKRSMELSSLGLKMKWQSLRRDSPQATQIEIQQLFEDWLYRRDSAPLGDCPGIQRQIK
jgi:Rv0078B-related antitoxin